MGIGGDGIVKVLLGNEANGLKWIYKSKTNSNGCLLKHKAFFSCEGVYSSSR